MTSACAVDCIIRTIFYIIRVIYNEFCFRETHYFLLESKIKINFPLLCPFFHYTAILDKIVLTKGMLPSYVEGARDIAPWYKCRSGQCKVLSLCPRISLYLSCSQRQNQCMQKLERIMENYLPTVNGKLRSSQKTLHGDTMKPKLHNHTKILFAIYTLFLSWMSVDITKGYMKWDIVISLIA